MTTQEIQEMIITRAKTENMTRGQVMTEAGKWGLGGQDAERNVILEALKMAKIGDAFGTPQKCIGSRSRDIFRRMSAMKDARRDALA